MTIRKQELNLKGEERAEFKEICMGQQRQFSNVLQVFSQQSQAQSQQQNIVQQQMHALLAQ